MTVFLIYYSLNSLWGELLWNEHINLKIEKEKKHMVLEKECQQKTGELSLITEEARAERP